MPTEEQQIREIRLALERATETVIRKISLDVTANLIKTTPVDTGWARANWVPAVGKRFQGTVGSREDAQAGRVSAGAQATGQARVAGYRLTDGRVFVSNNVPYILRLNDGSSTQAPAGFIQAAINKALTRDILELNLG